MSAPDELIKDGVAKQLGHLTQRSYKKVEVSGSTHNWAAFFVPTAGRRRLRVDN